MPALTALSTVTIAALPAGPGSDLVAAHSESPPQLNDDGKNSVEIPEDSSVAIPITDLVKIVESDRVSQAITSRYGKGRDRGLTSQPGNRLNGLILRNKRKCAAPSIIFRTLFYLRRWLWWEAISLFLLLPGRSRLGNQ